MTVTYGQGGPHDVLEPRDVWQAIRRGFACRCPACGGGKLFNGYVSVAPVCSECGEVLSHHRADDLPAYLTIVIVGHVIVPSMYMVERAWHPEMWVHLALWLPMILILSFGLLRPIKGAVVGLQWANYMHGFDPRGADGPVPDPAGGLR